MTNAPTTADDLVQIDLEGEALSPELEAELRAYEEAERERLGLQSARRQWADSMLAPEMRKSERAHVTLLVGGLTAAQDFLVEGALRGVGYKVEWLGVPSQPDFQTGKEYGNRGQCNPTYFTVGRLVRHLIELRDKEGIPTEEILKKYVFLTAGACGPCRFGMYVTEFRKALRDAGFDGFRVMLFQQQGGLSQATGDDVGLEMNPDFFVAIVKALVCGDVLNALAYRVRPYETTPGATNAAVEDAKRILYRALVDRTNVFAALYRCRRRLARVEVDRLRPKPKVAIIGEFWAMTTEGDGNYQLQKFLESEGAECDIQLTTAWLLYNIWEVARDTRERTDLRAADASHVGMDGLGDFGVAKRQATLRLAEAALRVGFRAFAEPIGLQDYPLPDMDEVAEVANAHYSNDLRGGEGHMEVGKLILNVVHAKAHMTLSVKPFGCMPSSGVSDGVQSLITSRYPGSIYCAVETSGDGATNFYSRVQMYLFKARQAAEEELRRAFAEEGVSEAEVRGFLAKHPKYASPFHCPPHAVAGTAANLVKEVAPMIRTSRLERAARAAARRIASTPGTLRTIRKRSADAARWIAQDETRARLRADAAILADLATGKAPERIRPLVERLAQKALG